MTENLFTALIVSILALTVIFLVLGILIGVIKVLVNFLPYKEEKIAPQVRQAPAPDTLIEEHIAVIHATIASHLGKLPHEIRITNITSI